MMGISVLRKCVEFSAEFKIVCGPGYQVSEMVQPLSGSLHMFFSVIQVTEVNPQTMNLPQDTIIKVGRGGGQQPGK